MCLALLQLPNTGLLEKELFSKGFSRNPHGGGYMFVEDGKLVIRKPFWKVGKMYESYREDYERCGADSHFAVHFRLATQGSVNGSNCHPHEIKPYECALIHNGCLPFEEALSDKSDSFILAEILSNYPSGFLSSVPLEELEDIVGGWNKVVILDSENNAVILNEENGHWENGVWYSGHVW